MPLMDAKEISATGIGFAAPTRLNGVTLTAGAADATLVIHDNAAAAAGQVVARLAAKAGTSQSLTGLNVVAHAGLYVTLTGAGSSAVLYTP